MGSGSPQLNEGEEERRTPQRRALPFAGAGEYGDQGTPDQFRQDPASMPPPKAPDGNPLSTNGAPISETWASGLPAAKPSGPADGPMPPNPEHVPKPTISQALGHGNLLFSFDDKVSRDDRPAPRSLTPYSPSSSRSHPPTPTSTAPSLPSSV